MKTVSEVTRRRRRTEEEESSEAISDQRHRRATKHLRAAEQHNDPH